MSDKQITGHSATVTDNEGSKPMQGQHVLITAGASGIGKAMASAFDEAGALVWVVDIDQEALAACPGHWQRTALNVTDEVAVKKLFTAIGEAWGRVDVLCANAGVAGPTAKIEDVELADWQHCVSVNLEGAFLFAKYTTPLMKAQQSGCMLLTSSTAGIYGFPNRSPYSAAKWGIIGLMKTLAMELGPYGIRANAICPGCVEGERIEGVMEREAAVKGTTRDAIFEAYSGGTSMRCFVSAGDVADMAVFLASKGALRVSGQVIAVDGHTENPDPKVGSF